MNEGILKNTNSWHWLGAVSALALAASIFMPGAGWISCIDAHRRYDVMVVAKAKAEYQRLRTLDADEAEALERKAEAVRKATEESKKRFAGYGFEPAAGKDAAQALFAAQGRVNEALAAHRLRVVAAEAVTSGKPPKPTAVAYKTAGEFSDAFMFLVAETHKRPAYSLSDIAAVRGEGGATEVSFKLKVAEK